MHHCGQFTQQPKGYFKNLNQIILPPWLKPTRSSICSRNSFPRPTKSDVIWFRHLLLGLSSCSQWSSPTRLYSVFQTPRCFLPQDLAFAVPSAPNALPSDSPSFDFFTFLSLSFHLGRKKKKSLSDGWSGISCDTLRRCTDRLHSDFFLKSPLIFLSERNLSMKRVHVGIGYHGSGRGRR